MKKKSHHEDSSELVNLEKVSFHYSKRIILDEVNLSLAKGSMTSIIGKSGSGKSTLLYILGGFLKPAKGRYLFDAKPVYSFAEFGLGRFRKKNIGFVFQDFRLLSFLTVEQNIRFPLWFSGKPVQKEHIQKIMSQLGIEHRKKAKPHSISGGEAQRTAIGRALLLKPRLILLDEPTGNLDQNTELEIIEVLKTLRSEGYTLVCITHSNEIMAASDNVYHLDQGKLSVYEKQKPRQRRKKKTGSDIEKGTDKDE